MGLADAQRKKPDPKGNVLYEFNKIKSSNWSESPGLTGRGSVVAWILDSGEIDCEEAPFGVIGIFDMLIRIVVTCENSLNGTIT